MSILLNDLFCDIDKPDGLPALRRKGRIHAQAPHGGQPAPDKNGRQAVPFLQGNPPVQAEPLHAPCPPGPGQGQPLPRRAGSYGDGRALPWPSLPEEGKSLSALRLVQQGQGVLPPFEGTARDQLDLRQQLGAGFQNQPAAAVPGGDAAGEAEPPLLPPVRAAGQVHQGLQVGRPDVLPAHA